jgi:hypothetical protein
MFYVQFEELYSIAVAANFILEIHAISVSARIFIYKIHANSPSETISFGRTAPHTLWE